MRGGQLRIIGGEWRGRKLEFPERDGLRPTPDRVRETLFNWLQYPVHGSRCLDLFAGSGALGFESASRGAVRVVMVERDRNAADAIEAGIGRLGAEQVRLVRQDAHHYLAGAAEAFDIVYLDPPFAESHIQDCCAQLEKKRWLSEHAYIYIEYAAGDDFEVPANWNCTRHKRAGQVEYRLYRRDPA